MSYSDNEYIKLNRKIKNWEWYTDINTSHFFIYCLLKANWKDAHFQGKEIKRGSFVSSLDKMKLECGLSIQQIRTAINKLQLTGEITNKSYTKYRIITVNNYDQYQSCNKQNNKEDNKQVTNNQQTNNKQITTIEEKKEKKEQEELKNNNPPLSPLGEMVDETGYTKTLKDKLHDWLRYKSEKKQSYKPTGFKTLLKKIDDVVKSAGEQAVINAIDASMSNNYQGLFFDKFIIDTTSIPKQKTFNMDDFLRRYDE